MRKESKLAKWGADEGDLLELSPWQWELFVIFSRSSMMITQFQRKELPPSLFLRLLNSAFPGLFPNCWLFLWLSRAAFLNRVAKGYLGQKWLLGILWPSAVGHRLLHHLAPKLIFAMTSLQLQDDFLNKKRLSPFLWKCWSPSEIEGYFLETAFIQ